VSPGSAQVQQAATQAKSDHRGAGRVVIAARRTRSGVRTVMSWTSVTCLDLTRSRRWAAVRRSA